MARPLTASPCTSRHLAYLAGASVIALSLSSPVAFARSLNGGGGGGAVSAPNIASDAATQAATQAAAAARQTQDSLARAARAVQDIQAVQAAARAAAAAAQVSATAPIAVPNGLGAGGLLPNLPAGWTGANTPTQSVDGNGQTQVNVRQLTQQAILNWQSFNVGARTTLTFDQGGNASWVALNRVSNATTPSQILGNIKADGHVYVINRSGIIFGGNAQVNVGALIASTAGITDAQFTANGIYSAQSGATFTPSFTAAGGKVVVEAGAIISTRAPTSVTSGGGYVLMIGSQVENAGSIATPKGQTLLAAGDDFVIRRGLGTDANTSSTTRGNELSPVIAANSANGLVRNSGLVFAQQGDITLAGRTIVQDGALISTTSVNTRGTVHLLNRASDTAGSVVLGAGSLTTILPELGSKETALDSQRDALIAASDAANLLRAASATGAFDNLSLLADRQDQSRIEIVTGGSVVFKGGSYTAAQGGQIAVSAGKRIFTEDGARLDVSGLRNVALAMSNNNIKVNVQGNELRDSPQNRDASVLKSNDVWIDVRNLVFVPAGTGGYASDRYYTSGGLLEVGGYLNTTAHGIGEWAAVGGSITLAAPEVVAQKGAQFDLSGGSLDYAAGWIRSTNLIGSDGRRYSVDDAPARLGFVSFAGGFARTHNIQGKQDDRLTEVWTTVFDRGRTSLRWEDGYSVGRDAGRLVLSAPTSIFEADIIADVVNGERQNSARAAAVADGYKQVQNAAPLAGTLALGQYTSTGRTELYETDIRIGDVPDIATNLDAHTLSPTARANTAWLDADRLSAYRLGRLELGTRGAVAIGGDLTLADGGALDLTAAFVDINAAISARGGSVTATNVFTLPTGSIQSLTVGGRSAMTLHENAQLDLRGARTNALLGTRQDTAYLDGGSVSLQSSRDVILEQGSQIDVSSGASISMLGKTSGGRGGNVTLSSSLNNNDASGQFVLNGSIRAYGVNGGGTLNINSGRAIVIGGSRSDASMLHLDASLFQTGFSQYAVTSGRGLTVAEGTTLDVVMPVYRFASNSFADTDLADGLEVWTPPPYVENVRTAVLTQRKGASLSLSAGYAFSTVADLATLGVSIEQGAIVRVDPGQTIRLLSNGQISVDGTLEAWSGTVEMGSTGATLAQDATQGHSRSIRIGATGVVDVAARSVTALDARGQRYGIVKAGGNIRIGGTFDPAPGENDVGDLFVVVERGAKLDASGTQAVLDVPGKGATAIASNGGSISLASRSGLYLDGSLKAFAGGASAAGGRLSVALEDNAYETAIITDRVKSGGKEFVLTQVHEGENVPSGSMTYGHALLGVNQITAGGFGSVALLSDGFLSFDGSVDLKLGQSVELYAGTFGLAETANANARIGIAAPYVRLAGSLAFSKDNHSGSSFATGTSQPASTAQFQASAQLLDIRDNVTFGRIASETVIRRGFTDVGLSSTGDIRLLAQNVSDWTRLRGMNNLQLTAAQIYPTTNARVSITTGHLTTARSGAEEPAVPYSVFGMLDIIAETVDHGGILRVPLGELVIGTTNGLPGVRSTSAINLLPGSILSVSANGLVMPYGGTVDGVTYSYDGKSLADTLLGIQPRSGSISLQGQSVAASPGSVIDLSGGGNLTGAGFTSGRGGSVDILTAPLVAANPGFGFSASGNKIYAIVPGHSSSYAPANSPAAAGDPVIGQTVTLDGSVAGLPAGTYTLMPSNYALLPGAVRVEIGSTMSQQGATQPVALGNGSFAIGGRLGIANTAVLDSLSRQIIVTPAASVRRHSLYNETGFAQFAIADAARLGVPRIRLPMDARSLTLELTENFTGRPSLSFAGDMRNASVEGGWGSQAFIMPRLRAEILAAGQTATPGFGGISLTDTDLNALNVSQLMIGGKSVFTYGQGGNFVNFTSNTGFITVRSGAVLRAADVFLITSGVSGGITVEQGARLDTLGRGTSGADSRDGFVYAPGTRSILAVSNGILTMLAPETDKNNASNGPGRIELGICSSVCSGVTRLYSEGTIVAATNNLFRLEDSVHYGTRNLTLAVGGVNVGTDESLAAAASAGKLPPGLAMSQTVLDRLLKGDTSTGAPALETLVLNAREAFSLFGTVTLDTIDPATGKSRLKELVLTTPGLYGAGSAGDVATIRTGTLIWNGTTTPTTSVLTGGAGTGTGTLSIEAERIELGYGGKTLPSNSDDNARLVLGFGTMNIRASERVTANHKGSLAVYQSQGGYVAGSGYSYQGGNLNIAAPLLTGEAGSISRITAGGTIRVMSSGAAAGQSAASADALGAELALNGNNLVIDGNVVLPSGKLTLTAVNDLTLTSAARLDVAGREVTFSDIKKYSWGGDVILESREGAISQAAGSVIDLSAANNKAGSLTVTALNAASGVVDLQGTVLGSTSGRYDAGGTLVPYRGGAVTVRAQRLGGAGTLSDQFAALNNRLNAGNVGGGRSFQFKQGDLVIGNEIKAGEVSVSLDGGHLTVNGTIDASGERVGTIRLAGKKGLTLTGSTVLDAHGTVLRVDSYGRIIDSPNRVIVELNSGDGRLTLAQGVRIDLRHGTDAPVGTSAGQNDGRARGTLDLNAPRIGSGGRTTDTDAITYGDIDIDVSGMPNILGARSIAVNAVRSYDDAPYAAEPAANGRPYQYIDQNWLNQRNNESSDFIDAALGNGALVSGKLGGLNNATYRDAFHLRPSVEVVSKTPDGDLVVQGDLDMSGHRYASLNPNSQQRAGIDGSGEAGTLALRAGGDLSIYGSINDGFAPPPETPDDAGWVLKPGKQMFNGDVVVPRSGIALQDGTTFPAGVILNYDLPIAAMTVAAGTRLPIAATLAETVVIPQNTILAAAIRNSDGSIAYAAGTRLAQAVTLTSGMTLDAGTLLAGNTPLAAMVWPRGVALPHLPANTITGENPDVIRQTGVVVLGIGAIIPAGTDVKLAAGVEQINLRDGNGKGANWAIAQMLPEGSQSWTLRLVAGADTAAADNRLTTPNAANGTLRLADTHYGMVGTLTSPQVLTEEASLAWYFDTSHAGYPLADFLAENGLTEADFCSWGAYCTVDPNAPATYAYAPGRANFSVLRTGSGDLDLISGRDLTMQSLYGVYTAGTSSVTRTDGRTSGFDLARGTAADRNSGLNTGLVLGNRGAEFEKFVNGSADSLYRAWYPDRGGNLLLSVGGNLTGDVLGTKMLSDGDPIQVGTSNVGNWLWRQGSGSVVIDEAIPTAWWINFGSYVADGNGMRTAGFTGFGTLGGGNVDVRVGGDAGMLVPRGTSYVGSATRSQALVLAVGSTGRIVNGELQQTGGGDLDIRIGGGLNPALEARAMQDASARPRSQRHDLTGAFVDLRGTVRIDAGSLGGIQLVSGKDAQVQDPKETRAYDPFTPSAGTATGGLILVPGDATVNVTTRGDLVLGGVVDAGRAPSYSPSAMTINGIAPDGSGYSWFSLWTDRTAIDLFSAGGNLTPITLSGEKTIAGNDLRTGFDYSPTDGRFVYPSILRAVVANGSFYYGPSGLYDAQGGGRNDPAMSLVLAPGSNGELTFLAANSIYAGGYAINASSAGAATLATPFNPGFVYGGYGRYVTNAGSAMVPPEVDFSRYPMFAFGGDTASGRNTSADAPIRFYARDGDIVGLRSGQIIIPSQFNGWPFRELPTAWYEAARPVWIRAGRDIVNSGSHGSDGVSNLIMHNSETDVSMVTAGRDLIYSSFTVAGPGTLEISAGRNIQMEDRASVTSIGAIVPGDARPGAGISMLAGAGSDGPNYAALLRYLDPANAVTSGTPLDGSGKVGRTYEKELAAWLTQRYGFEGKGDDARSYFGSLAPEQQRIFLRDVYYAELTAGGREYNDPTSTRFGSYLRGRAMIASLFPGNSYSGDIVMFGGSGVRTDFGGGIQLLAPGGQIVIGVEGTPPPASAGLITQGAGDIQIYSQGSVLLGLSRIMTTFGGSIIGWSAAGDINAGRGAKTTVLHTPPKRVYDKYGNVTLSPNVPSSGAGIATLNPIPEVRAGDIDLIAPLGTIDAGEAGIRVSGNVNLAALQVLNAANIQVQGTTTGIPTVQAPSITAALSSSNATAATQQTATPTQGSGNAQPSVIIVEVLGYGGGEGDSNEERRKRDTSSEYDPNSPFQLIGNGKLTERQRSELTSAEQEKLDR